MGHTVLRGMSPLCPPLPGKAIKLSFSTSPKTLSLRFNSAPVQRGRAFSINPRVSSLPSSLTARPQPGENFSVLLGIPFTSFTTNGICLLICLIHCWEILKGGDDLGRPWPAAAWSRISVPGQRLRSGSGSESAESQPLDHQGPGASDKTLAHQLCRNEFPHGGGK